MNCLIPTEDGSFSQSRNEGKIPRNHKPSGEGYRRKRTAFSNGQLERLETTFQFNMYPGVTERESLATELGISEACVQVRFPANIFLLMEKCHRKIGPFLEKWCYNRPLSLGGHVESQENKKLCLCTASLAPNSCLGEANRTKTKLFIVLRLIMAPRDKGLYLFSVTK